MSVDVLPGSEPFSHVGGPHGVLVLHGFTGNPGSMRPLAQRCADAGYGVELPRLAGHGTNVEDLMTTAWADWLKGAEEAYDTLAERSDAVAVVGLSMGGALAARVAELRSVAGCVLINPLVKVPPSEVVEGVDALIAGGVTSFDSIGSDIKREGGFEGSYNATPLVPLRSLFAGVATVEEDLSRIDAPCLVLVSREDHVITWDRADELVEKVRGPLERVWLEDSFHVATMDNDQALVESLTLDFLARVFD
jgi:carboxylesterase